MKNTITDAPAERPQASIANVPADLAEHPAALAWSQLAGSTGGPAAIELLKRSRASIYRLVGAGPAGTNVIAKHGSPVSLRVEHTIYEEALPLMRTASLRSYGFLVDDDELGWLFLEDADCGDRNADTTLDLALLARWLHELHTVAIAPATVQRLPAREPRHYLTRLRAVRTAAAETSRNAAVRAEQRSTLATVLDQCDRIEALWSRLESSVSIAPSTVVHGDLVSKNTALARRKDRTTLLVFDWEEAGWGTPAVDLVAFGLGRNHTEITRTMESIGSIWPEFSAADRDRLVSAGGILWLLGVLSGGLRDLDHPWIDRPLAKVEVYTTWMKQALHAFEAP